MSLEAIKYKNGILKILDQLLLPLESQYVDILGVEDAWNAIKTMQVRGAPAIAIVGCLSLAVELYKKEFQDKDTLIDYVKTKLSFLITSRPTAVNMANEANKLIDFCMDMYAKSEVNDMKQSLIDKIEEMLKIDIETNKNIGKFGAEKILIPHPGKINVLTHCNTGALATAGYGTALGVIRRLHDLGRIERVFCTETRPYMQGSRLTAYELVYENIPSSLICDSMVGALFQHTKITAVIVGADRVASNGDTANKIGTYQLAVLAKHHNVPFYVCSPLSTVDFNIKSGVDIKIEERSEVEMTEILGKRIAAPGIKCWNPAFDVTPGSLITGIVTEKGVIKPNNLSEFNL